MINLVTKIHALYSCTYHILIVINAYDKVKRSITAIDYFILTMLQETALVFRPTQAFTNELTFESHSFAHAETIEVFGEARLTLLVDHQHELYHLVLNFPT